jgi:hypothetical protein
MRIVVIGGTGSDGGRRELRQHGHEVIVGSGSAEAAGPGAGLAGRVAILGDAHPMPA